MGEAGCPLPGSADGPKNDRRGSEASAARTALPRLIARARDVPRWPVKPPLPRYWV